MKGTTFTRWKGAHALVLCAVACSIVAAIFFAVFRTEAAARLSDRTLSFAERVAYQRVIEGVYWRHRIWPKERSDPKPSLDEVMSQEQLEKKVANYLRDSQALGDYYQRTVGAAQLQAEMDRMAQHTKRPEVLRELFEALGNDPFVIAECLARPALTERFINRLDTHDRRFNSQLKQIGLTKAATVRMAELSRRTYTLPVISSPLGSCTDDTWTATSLIGVPAERSGHTAVWTGTEMIVWGGGALSNTGGRYNPAPTLGLRRPSPTRLLADPITRRSGPAVK